MGELPDLKSVHESFKDKPNFVMISLSLDEKPATAKSFVEKQGLTWTQGFLGSWDTATAAKDYGVKGIPSLWLIGPDGKVVAKNFRAAEARTPLAQHLGG